MAIGQTASAGSAGDGGTSIGGYVEVTMPKPSDPSVDLHYKGNVQGRCQLVPYELNDQTKLDEDHWRLLEWLGWSVYTLKFNQFPIQPGEKRWLRLHASGGVQRQNRRSKSDRRKEKYLGQIRHTFEVAGPLDVRHRVRRYLGLAPVVVAQNELPREYGQAAGIIDELQELLLKKGLEVPDTQTSILDWRINLFWTDSYTDCDEPLPFGDIQPAGGAYNVLLVTKGALLEAYQYLAGERFCANNHKGLFRLRVVARRISSGVVGMLPLFAIGLALISLLLAVITLIW